MAAAADFEVELMSLDWTIRHNTRYGHFLVILEREGSEGREEEWDRRLEEILVADGVDRHVVAVLTLLLAMVPPYPLVVVLVENT